MSLVINWSSPYRVYDGPFPQWRREWCISDQYLSEFFAFWKRKKYEMLAKGFTIIKTPPDNKWYLLETKDSVGQFHLAGTPQETKIEYIDPEVNFVLPDYKIKDISGLRPWQVNSVGKLISAINQWGSGIDGSELGVGKSFVAGAVIRELDVPFVIVCPKPVINQWNKIIHNHFKINHNLKGIINYELLIRGRKDSDIASYITKKNTKRKVFTWKIPKNSVIIYDEAHRLKNFKTQASKTSIMAHKQKYKQLFLSATLATTPLEIRTVGTCTGLFNTAREYYDFIEKHGCYRGMWGMEFNNDPIALKRIHKFLFKNRGIRLKRDTIPNFPQTEIIVDAYNMDEESTQKIRDIYTEMRKELKVLNDKEKKDKDNEMVIRIRALQKTEMLKVPLMEEMIRDGLEAGMSIVVFLNYSDSIDALAQRLNTKCIYDGRNEPVRQQYIDLFQSNKENLLVTNIAAAREGLDLPDLDGNHPRYTVISPTYSIVKIKQALGRVHRESSKSKSIQKIVYVANTQEEDVVISAGQKLQNLTLINDGEITDEDLKI